MKKGLNLLSLLGIGFALFVLGDLHFSTTDAAIRTEAAARTAADVRTVVDPSLNQGVDGLKPFEHLTLGAVREIDFDVDREMFGELSRRQQRDQLLDWSLYAVLTDSGSDAQEIAEIAHDLPPLRSGYLKPVAEFEYGPTRSRYIGEGRVVALIPGDATAAERRDHISHVADLHRKDLGEKPKKILIFEYDLDFANLKGRLTQQAAVVANEVFSESYGYFEYLVTDGTGFSHFMSKVADLTFAKKTAKGLRLGGRKLMARQYRGIRAEDVAAIWQAERKIYQDLASFEAKWQRVADNHNSKWSGRRVSSAFEKARLEREADREWEAIEARMVEDQRNNPLVQGSGFSLDPVTVYPQLIEHFEAFSEACKEWLADPRATFTQSDLNRVRAKLGKKNLTPYFKLADQLQKSVQEEERMLGLGLEAVFHRDRIQAARYDGNLQGTEVGMVLFYTDLLAKLWALDFQLNTPVKVISDFQPMTTVVTSPVFEAEGRKLTSTRVWFGTQDRGFQVSSNNSLLFARNAARIYAASAESLKPGEEGEPNASSEAFLGWWNDHYEEVARYEPEYERLNEIMKWSLLISWLNERNGGNRLSFLADQKVHREHWFPDWVKEHPELRFRQWSKIGFFPRGAEGTTTEALPILSSDLSMAFVEGYRALSGGVSLANKRLFSNRTALNIKSSGPQRIQRSHLDYGTFGNQKNSFKTLSGVKHQIKNSSPARSTATSTPRPAAKLRSLHGQMKNTAFKRNIVRVDGRLSIETQAGGRSLGQLDVTRTGNGFKVGWKGRDLDAGHSLARRLSRETNVEKALVADKKVEAAFKLEEGVYAAKLRDTNSWVKVAPEKKPSIDIADGWSSRVSDPRGGQHNIQLAWLKKAETHRILNDKTLVPLKTAKKPSQTIHSGNGTRPPPPEIAAIRKGDFRSVARRVAEDPRQFKKNFDGHVKDRLQEVDHLLANNRAIEALELLSALRQVTGKIPDIQFRRGLAYLEQRRPRQAVKSLGDGPGRPPYHPDSFFKEVNRRLGQPNRGLNERQDIHHLAKLADWQIQLAKKTEAGSVKAVVKEGRLELHVKLAKDTPLERLSAAEVKRLSGRERVYVQDSPSLNHLDWSSNVQRSLQEVVSGQIDGKVFRLPRGDIAHFDPAVTYAPGISTKALNRVGPQTKTTAPPFRQYVRYRGPSDDDDEEEEEDDEEDEDAKKKKAAEKEKEILLVVIDNDG